jgi:short-subunit dehydrogenase
MRAIELSAEQVARAGLNGLMRGKFLIVPGWWYKLNLLAARFLPRTLVTAASERIVK